MQMKQSLKAYENLLGLEQLRRDKYGAAACDAPMEKMLSIHTIPDDPNAPDPRG
jgi:hypothetical protein